MRRRKPQRSTLRHETTKARRQLWQDDLSSPALLERPARVPAIHFDTARC